MRILTAVLVVGLAASAGDDVWAQPTVRDHRPGPRPKAPPTDEPREAPPPPRVEKQAARPGFTWISGRWQWRGGKWEWLAGHWERERAGKKWREGRWDRKGDRWVYSDGGWTDASAPTPTPPPADTGPSDAPPSPREEKIAARKGFVYVRGRWDWRGGKWEWMAGHWERERPGKSWRDGRWERKDSRWVFVDGEWIDGTATTPPPRPDQPPEHRPRRVWKLERPVVSSYWPAKGKVGTRIVIRGRNFPADTMVMWGGRELVRAARVKPTDITFEVPRNATTARIMLKAGARQVGVGTFEVAADFDAAAEAKKREDERRRAAETAWRERQKRLATDRAEREAEVRRRSEERERTREERRRARAEAIRARWDRAFLADQATQDELTLHAQRVAELVRMSEVADLASNGKLAVRIEVASARENERHEQRMQALKADFQGGTP